MQQIDFKRLAGEFAAGEKIGGGGLHGRIVTLDAQLRLGVFLVAGKMAVIFFRVIFVRVIEHDGDEGFGFQLGRSGEEKLWFS